MLTRGRFKYWPHVALVNQALIALVMKWIDILIVIMPPRHGKSELISKWFPFWFLKTFPDYRIILTSYADALANHWGRTTRDLFASFPEFTGHLRLDESSQSKSQWGIAAHGGGLLARGIGGAITGFGAHIGIIDDPIKNAEEALSEVVRENIWQWYLSTFYSRLEPGGGQIITGTRWHEDDLIGRILASPDMKNKRVKIIHLPALATGPDDLLGRAPGEALCPERYSREQLLDIQRTLTETTSAYFWEALYQGAPTNIQGALFKRDYFTICSLKMQANAVYLDWVDKAGVSHFANYDECSRFQVVDLNHQPGQENDYMIIQDWLVTPSRQAILFDQYRAKPDPADHEDIIFDRHRKFNSRFVGIETTAYQGVTAQRLLRRNVPAIPFKPDKSKLARALPAAALAKSGQMVFLDRPYLPQLIDEAVGFPHMKHDDQVDGLSMAANVLTQQFQTAGSGVATG